MTTISDLYYDEGSPAGFSTLRKLRAAVLAELKKGKSQSVAATRLWYAYTLHRPVRKHFARNPYTVTNVRDVWECDLLDEQSYAKYNDKFRYILSVIDVFSKFLYLIPVKTKSGPAVTAAFRFIFDDKLKLTSRRPVWVRTDKGKEFLNKAFQDMLRDEGIQFQVCRNFDVKCAVVERAQRTIRDRLHKYLTHKNTFRYIDVLPKFVRAFNDTVHSTTGMAPSRVTDSDVLTIWKRMHRHRRRIRVAKVKFNVGQHVRISKEKMKFAKGGEQIFSTEIFRNKKVIERRPQPVYELVDLNKTPIEGQFYAEELTPVLISNETTYKIDNIIDMRVSRGIREYLVRWLRLRKGF